MWPRLPTKLKDRFEAYENARKRAELNERRRRKMVVHKMLNHRLELERLRGLTANQRMASLRHVEAREQNFELMIKKVLAGRY